MVIFRVLHSAEGPGPTVVSVWKRYITGQPFVVSRNIIVVGDSGTEVYGSSGKSHHLIVSDLRTHCGYPNIHNLTEVGAHPRRWTELLVQCKNQNLHCALPKSGKPGAPAFFGSDFVVIVVDAHNGLQMGNNYTGLKHKTPTGRTMYEEYQTLLDELSYFAQVVYGYSDCSERFQMDSTLDEEARTCAVIARNYGLIPYSLRDFWETIKPFCLGMESAGRSLNCWHHCDYGDQFKLQYFWDQLIKKLTYLAVANSWGGSLTVALERRPIHLPARYLFPLCLAT